MDKLIEFVTAHIWLWSAMAIVVVLIIINEIRDHMGNVPKISPQDAVNKINHENAVVLDIRNKNDYSQGHIIGAKHIARDEVAAKIGTLTKWVKNKETALILVDNSMSAAQSTASELRNKHGFSHLFCLTGGMAAWNNENLPLVKD